MHSSEAARLRQIRGTPDVRRSLVPGLQAQVVHGMRGALPVRAGDHRPCEVAHGLIGTLPALRGFIGARRGFIEARAIARHTGGPESREPAEHQHGARLGLSTTLKAVLTKPFEYLARQLWRRSVGIGIMHAATASVSPTGNPRPKRVASGPGPTQQAASAEAAPSEPDSILEMLQANNRATCLSPLPLLHWLYVTYVVDEKYEVQQQPAVATSRPAPPVPPQR